MQSNGRRSLDTALLTTQSLKPHNHACSITSSVFPWLGIFSCIYSGASVTLVSF